MKICNKCEIEKENNQFAKNRNQCKACIGIYKKKWRSDNKERIKIHNKTYCLNNKEKIKTIYNKANILRVSNLDDSYIKCIISNQCNIQYKNIPKTIIELKRKQIQIKRLIKQIQL